MTEGSDGGPAAAISLELASCRKRGIERIDVRSHNQAPVPAPELERLASDYMLAAGRSVKGRIAQIKYLLRDALDVFGGESEPDAKLITALFFGDSQHYVTKSASELLDTARRQYAFGSELRFRQAWHNAFSSFAEFLLRFAAIAPPEDGTETPPEAAADGLPYSHDSVLAPEVQRQVATIGYVDSGEHFITLLSQADKVTIVGLTNESLASMLRTALDRKREAIFRSDECWSSVRVVFLAEELLDRVNDERGFAEPSQARLQRQRLGVFGRRTVRVLLKGLPTRSDWAMYDLPHLPPLIGTLFEMPDGRRIVQLLIRRQLGNAGDHLYLEFEDTRAQYFSTAFDEITRSSIDDNKVAPVGRVTGQRFQVRETKYRWSVLIDGSHAKDWLAMVLVVTWRIRDGRAEPLLQLRTRLNATRELNRLTHLAGHITHDDPSVEGTEFGLDDAVPLAAARKRIQMETGPVDTGDLAPLTTGVYVHWDKEHLFFFVYSCRLPDGLEVWPQAEMSPVSVPELLSIRKNQVLRNAVSLCQAPPARRQVRIDAFEIVALNLILHDLADVAQQLTDAAAAARAADFGALEDVLGRLEAQTRQTWPGYEGDVELEGLSGLQFREFYAILLPFYEAIGVHGAAEALALIGEDMSKRAAVDRLSQLYRDERLMRSIPIEL